MVRRTISERRFEKADFAPVDIGEFCFIGTNATILMGAVIGHHSVIGAGCIVPQFSVFPPYSIVGGVPAKVIGSSKKFLKGIEEETISVVIPAYNERLTIEAVVKEAEKVLKGLKIDYEIVLVNDGSTDGTGKIIDKLSKADKHIRALHHRVNKGFTGAMKTCFSAARKHFIFLAPADGAFDFKELPKFLEAIKGYDVVTAYIIRKNESFITKLKILIFHVPFLLLSRYLLGIKLKEFSSVSLWRQRVYQGIEVESKDSSAMFLPELISKALKGRYKFNEVQINWYKRKGGKAKGTNLKVALRTLVGMFKLGFKLKRWL